MEELVTLSMLIRLKNIYQIHFTCVSTVGIKFYHELMWLVCVDNLRVLKATAGGPVHLSSA